MKLELANLRSVRDFVANLKAFKSARPLMHLICNAAVYKPTDPNPSWTDDGFETTVGVNHLGHFLLTNLLLDVLSHARRARGGSVWPVTGNTHTIAGKFETCPGSRTARESPWPWRTGANSTARRPTRTRRCVT